MYTICILTIGFASLLANSKNIVVSALTDCEKMIAFYNFIGCKPMDPSFDGKCSSR